MTQGKLERRNEIAAQLDAVSLRKGRMARFYEKEIREQLRVVDIELMLSFKKPEKVVCECISNCCEGEHAGYCFECAGWGEVDCEPCDYCNGSGICPKCGGATK